MFTYTSRGDHKYNQNQLYDYNNCVRHVNISKNGRFFFPDYKTIRIQFLGDQIISVV